MIKKISLSLLGALALSTTPAQAFGPCDPKVPKSVSYLPSLAVCGGNAAIGVHGRSFNAFSAVVRDCNNNDRDPCNYGEESCASNLSSPFKAQKVVRAKVKIRGRERIARIFCLREPGDAPVYQLVRRMTIKLRDPVTSPDHILKLCLPSRTTPIHRFRVLEVIAQKSLESVGVNGACSVQQYLACDYSYENICPY